MPLDYATIISVLNRVVDDVITSQINRATVLLNVLRKTRKTAATVNWDVRFGTSTGAAIADGTTVSVFNADTKVNANLSFCTYNDAFQVYGRAANAAYNAGGPAALTDLLAEELENSAERLASSINADLYAGAGTTSPEVIAGFLVALAATGSYAGISRGDYAQWASNVLANGGSRRDLTIQLMRDMRKAIYLASGRKSDLIVCDPNQFERYVNLAQAERRFVQDVKTAGGIIHIDQGVTLVDFDGIPVLEDKDATAHSMFFLNTREIEVRTLPTSALNGLMSGRTVAVDGTEEEHLGMASSGMDARVQPLAITGDLVPIQLVCYPQLQVKRPNANGVIADLNS